MTDILLFASYNSRSLGIVYVYVSDFLCQRLCSIYSAKTVYICCCIDCMIVMMMRDTYVHL